MKLITIEEFKQQLAKKLEITHLGNLQIPISDKVTIHCVQSHETDYDSEDNEYLKSMEISVNFYGEHHDVTLKKDDNGCFEDVWSTGELIESLSSFIEYDFQPYIKVLWDAVEADLN